MIPKYFLSQHALIVLCFQAYICQSDAEELKDSLQFHGFATQSYIYTTDNNYFGSSKNGSWEFRELGINLLWRPLSRMHFSIQLVARDAGKTDDGEPRIDYGFIDYTLHNTEKNNSGLRIGRVMNPYGFYNDTRDIAATRPSILLPQSVYFDVNRNLALSANALQFYHNYEGDTGDYLFQLSVLEPRTKDPDLETGLFFQKLAGELNGNTSWAGRLVYEYDFGRVRLGLTAMKINLEYNPASNDSILPGDFVLYPYVLSVQYNSERWSLTSEYVYRDIRWNNFGPPIDNKISGHGYFAQGSYSLSNKWRLLLRYDKLIWDNDDPDGKDFESLTGIPHYLRFAKDLTISSRWDINQNVMLGIEWHKINGTGWLSLLENPIPANMKQRWDLYVFSASFRF